MNKITDYHLNRSAYIYVRQSTQDQVIHNLESRRRQYNLKRKALELGWNQVVVVDEDLGKTASGSVYRVGFEHLLAKVCEGTVGAVFAIEASRLARNGREWHTLLELCGFMQTLIIDHDGVYDPKHPNDRLLLGMKGTISEMELTVLRQRSQEALRQKAERGELYFAVAIGYRRCSDNRLEKDPDRRIREAMGLVFRKFREMTSVRQVLLWYRQEKVKLPAVSYSAGERNVVWKLPVYNTLYHILTNPVYGGAYAFGRTYTNIRIEEGRKRKVQGYRRHQKNWPILIKDHHEPYISWEEYQRNQRLIAENANMKGAMVRGSIKRGTALLAGLLRCGHCGRKLHVSYSGTKGKVVRYGCRGGKINHGTSSCISIGALRLEKMISKAVLEVLSPHGIEAALEAKRLMAKRSSEARAQKELTLQQARYEAGRAHKQYDLADPENRLVAAELERRWNERLQVVEILEEELAQVPPEKELGAAEKSELLALGSDVPFVWNHPSGDPRLKKRILRAVIEEVIISIYEGLVSAVVHWEGGDHSRIDFPKNKCGYHRWRTDVETERIIRELARVISDHKIASLLNRLGKKTAKGNSWTQMRVAAFRNGHNISAYQEGEVEGRGEVFLDQAAETLGVHKARIYKLIQKGQLQARQVCFGAPWLIGKEELQRICAILSEQGRVSSPLTPMQQNLFSDNTKT